MLGSQQALSGGKSSYFLTYSDPDCKLSGDMLGYHGHGSANTHLFIRGRVFLFDYDIIPQEGQRAPPSDERSSFSGPVVEGILQTWEQGRCIPRALKPIVTSLKDIGV
jgi:hypothetical protein